MHAVRARLRAATDSTHERVESSLGLLAPALTPADVADAIALLHGFWRPTELAVDAWARRSPALAQRVDWPRRRRAALQRADLGAAADEVAFAAGAAIDSDADVLGWLYVSEGSTLGGAVIARALRSDAPASFTPYPEGPGPMWRAYLDVLEEWVGTDELRAAAVTTAAAAAFTALADWIDDARADRRSIEGVA